MATLPVYNRTGQEVGSYELDPAALAPRINKQLLHDVVVMYQSNLRLGTSKTKSRGEVAGTTKKMYRQKGTGNARAGSRRSGIRRGGGHIFAKRPRDWSYRLPRKAVQLATRMALASKIRDGEMVVIDELSLESPKTKEMAVILRALRCEGASVLVATAAYDVNVYKSARNIAGVTVQPVSGLNALNVLAPRKLLVTKAALDAIRHKSAGGLRESAGGPRESAGEPRESAGGLREGTES
ncbi:MAG TPA: 50S ribosomal protein L4 [Pirellulales bacterium]|nr:50S ribosomal protein L4 [Pirellulales bacterium]